MAGCSFVVELAGDAVVFRQIAELLELCDCPKSPVNRFDPQALDWKPLSLWMSKRCQRVLPLCCWPRDRRCGGCFGSVEARYSAKAEAFGTSLDS